MRMSQARGEYQGYLATCKGEPTSLAQVISDRQGSGVTDARDMVYAHLSFASKSPDYPLLIDYNRSWKALYIEFALFIYKTYDINWCLSRVADSSAHNHPDSLPSWVPDWTKSPTPIRSGSHQWEEAIVNKHYWLIYRIITLQDPPVLSFYAKHMGEVTGLSVPLENALFPHGQPCINQEVPLDVSQERCRVNYESWRRVLGVDILPSFDRVFFEPFFREERHQVLNGKADWNDASLPILLIPELAPSLVGRRIAKMSHGKSTIVPANTLMGDIRVSIHAAYTWMIRPVASSSQFSHIDEQICRRLEEQSEINFQSRTVQHCHFIGEALTVRGPGYQSRSEIFALH